MAYTYFIAKFPMKNNNTHCPPRNECNKNQRHDHPLHSPSNSACVYFLIFCNKFNQNSDSELKTTSQQVHQYNSNSLSLGHLSSFQYFVLIKIIPIRLRACWFGSWLKDLIPMQKNTSENKAAENGIRQRLSCWLLHILKPN